MKLILLIMVLSIAAVPTMAQQQSELCVANRNAPPTGVYYWPPDTEVKVYFARGMFTAEQQKALWAAAAAWSDTNAYTGAGISYSYAGEIDEVITCTGCLKVTRRSVHVNDPRHYAFFYPLKRDSYGFLLSARIDLDFETVSARALQSFMAHELGHGVGLWDCKSCTKKKTIMSGFPGINDDNGLLGPSACDLEIVRQTYYLHRRMSRNIVAEKNK